MFNHLAKPLLLDDEAMLSFIREGYMTLQSDLPRDYHARMFAALDELEEGGPRGHNNLLPCVPELARVLEEPRVRGALTSILGANCYLHFHRHDHFTFPGDAQPLHKDSDNHSHLAVDGLRRMHRTRFAMLLYYPQDTPLEKGPTGVVPRSHYLPRRALEAARKGMHAASGRYLEEIERELGTKFHYSKEAQALLRERMGRFRAHNPAMFEELARLDEPWESAKIPLTGEAGTVAIVHFDIVHGRYSANTTDERRHMVKFLFARHRDPVAPSWRHGDTAWPAEDDPMVPVWQSQWNWHRGRRAARPAGQTGPAAKSLASEDEATAMAAAYALAGEGLDELLAAFLSDDVGKRTVAAYGLIEAGAAATPRLARLLEGADAELAVRILDVLGDIGPPASSALPQLLDALRHADANVRRYAVEAVGTVAQGTPFHHALLARPLADEDSHVRRNAALAIARLSPDIEDDVELVPLLADNLLHWHHHVRGWAIEALQRLRSERARTTAMRYLSTTRWDPAPKSGDTPLGAKSPRVVRPAR